MSQDKPTESEEFDPTKRDDGTYRFAITEKKGHYVVQSGENIALPQRFELNGLVFYPGDGMVQATGYEYDGEMFNIISDPEDAKNVQ